MSEHIHCDLPGCTNRRASKHPERWLHLTDPGYGVGEPYNFDFCGWEDLAAYATLRNQRQVERREQQRREHEEFLREGAKPVRVLPGITVAPHLAPTRRTDGDDAA